MTTILLVTGSRALVGSAHEAQARAILSAMVFGLPDGAVVVAGDASGPDEWAIRDAASGLLALNFRIYSLDGGVYDGSAARVRRWDHGLEDKRGSKGWPLLRNRLMVRDCARERDRGATVTVLALEAEWSRTKGTAQTVGVARDCGLAVTHVMLTEGRR